VVLVLTETYMQEKMKPASRWIKMVWGDLGRYAKAHWVL